MPKSGKTTIATRFSNHLLLAFEKGYSAIPGAMAMPINSWSEFKKALRQLKSEEVKSRFETIIIDTGDIAYDFCERHILAIEGKEKIGDIPFGQGYTMVGKEFDECLRLIVQLGYGLVIISHSTDKTFTDEGGAEYTQIVPTLPNKARLICQRMCDIICYSRVVKLAEGGTAAKLFLRGTPRFVAGSRFKYIPDVIDFNYKSLVEAIGTAIDKEEAENDSSLFTDKRENAYELKVELNFDALMKEFSDKVNTLMSKDSEFYMPRIMEVVENHLGKGGKVGDCTRDQVEIVDLIVDELKTIV